MKRNIFSMAIAGCLILTGCGADTGDRAASGAGIGAGAGAVIGAVTGLSILEGVVLGAAAGGIVGAVTDEDTINLGEPIWADADTPANKSAVSRVQAGLNRLGYEVGPTDGVLGPKTEAAIRSYQSDHELLVDGRPTDELARHIDVQLQLAGKN
jgi:peptidoglycan hydrolase-like protein with peptidoglycan-binding domain